MHKRTPAEIEFDIQRRRKTCSTCHVEKDFTEFANRKTSVDSKDNRCKQCVNVYYEQNKTRITSWFRTEYFPKNQEKFRLQRKQWKADNLERKRELDRDYMQRRRARMYGVVATLTNAEWNGRLEEFNYHCAYCGVWLDDPEQEHMQPISKGGTHTLANVVPACRSCNASKSSLTLLEFASLQLGSPLLQQKVA